MIFDRLKWTPLLLVPLISCGTSSRPSTPNDTGIAASGVREAATARPESTLAYFLRMSVPTRKEDRTTVDSIYGCADTENLDHMVWLADWRIDSSIASHDTSLVYVNLTTVARFRGMTHGYMGSLAVEEIPAVISLDRKGAGWLVCVNFRALAQPGDPFVTGGPVPGIEWRTPGATTSGAFAMVDSIRRSRGLPLIR